jgi:hypothetical protein
MMLSERVAAILDNHQRVVTDHRRPGDLTRMCAAGAVIHAAGGHQQFRQDVRRSWTEELVRVFTDDGRLAALAWLDEHPHD